MKGSIRLCRIAIVVTNILALDKVDNLFTDIRCVISNSFQGSRNNHLNKPSADAISSRDRIADPLITKKILCDRIIQHIDQII